MIDFIVCLFVFIKHTCQGPEYWFILTYLSLILTTLPIVKHSSKIVWELWSDTREFITRSVELWTRWIRLSCYYSRVYILCSL